jgi:hypothetical protein
MGKHCQLVNPNIKTKVRANWNWELALDTQKLNFKYKDEWILWFSQQTTGF